MQLQLKSSTSRFFALTPTQCCLQLCTTVPKLPETANFTALDYQTAYKQNHDDMIIR